MPTAIKTPLRIVCVVSSHPFVLEELAAHVGSQAKSSILKIALPTMGAPVQVSLPEANTYVVDGNAPVPSTHALLADLGTRFPAGRIVFITERLDEDVCFPVLRLGVRGLLTYQEAQQNLPRALELIATGGYWVPRALLSRFMESIVQASGHLPRPKGFQQLSPREQEVLHCLLDNLSNKEIASKLFISERTAKFHVSNLLTKFGARRRADLILACYQARTAP